jgi:WD40 repeat protein
LPRLHASTGELNDLQFSPDERSLAIANLNLTVYTVKDLTLLGTLRGDGRNYGTARFSADGRRLLTTTGAATIEVMDANSGETQTNICCSTIYGEAGFDPDGTMIVTAGHWPALWDARSGKLVRRLTRDREFEAFGPIAFDPVRGWIFMGSQDGRVYSWDLRTGQRTAISSGRAGYVDSTAAFGASPWIGYGTPGGPIRLWNPDNGEERQLAGAAATSNLVAGAEPNSVFFGTEAGFVELWDIASSKLSQRYDLR